MENISFKMGVKETGELWMTKGHETDAVKMM